MGGSSKVGDWVGLVVAQKGVRQAMGATSEMVPDQGLSFWGRTCEFSEGLKPHANFAGIIFPPTPLVDVCNLVPFRTFTLALHTLLLCYPPLRVSDLFATLTGPVDGALLPWGSEV